MRTLSIVDEIEIVMRERLWSPWYERYGPEFRDVMFHFPIEQTTPPNDRECDYEREAATCFHYH